MESRKIAERTTPLLEREPEFIKKRKELGIQKALEEAEKS
jgi:hypothetical protein